MDEKTLGKIKDTIPEIYFDIIARIIPGALSILVFVGERVLIDNGFLRIVSCLLFSYLCGIVIDISSDMILNRILFRPFFLLFKLFRIPILSDSILWIKIRKLQEKQGLVFNKMMAEKAMLRGIILLNLVVLFVRPSQIKTNHSFLWAIASLSIFLFCHFSLQLYITERITNIEGLLKKKAAQS